MDDDGSMYAIGHILDYRQNMQGGIIFDCEKVAIGGGISAQPLLIELINKNLDEISRLIDDATASTQETAAAAEELANLAENLNTLVSKFKTTSN